MSRSYTVKGSYASQSGARPRRTVNNDGMLQQERAEFSGDQRDESTQEDQTNPPANERYQRREAYTVIAPNEDKRQHLLRIQKEEEETARRQKEEKAKRAIRITPRPVGGPMISQREFIEHQQKAADKSFTAKAIEMREKRERWKRQAKEKEEKEIEMKKAAARKQAEKNERREAHQRETTRKYWDERFSNQSTSSSGQTFSRQHEDLSHEASDWRDFDSQERDIEGGDELVQLCRMFPNYDPTMLSDLLQEQGSVERVIMMLQG